MSNSLLLIKIKLDAGESASSYVSWNTSMSYLRGTWRLIVKEYALHYSIHRNPENNYYWAIDKEWVEETCYVNYKDFFNTYEVA